MAMNGRGTRPVSWERTFSKWMSMSARGHLGQIKWLLCFLVASGFTHPNIYPLNCDVKENMKKNYSWQNWRGFQREFYLKVNVPDLSSQTCVRVMATFKKKKKRFATLSLLTSHFEADSQGELGLLTFKQLKHLWFNLSYKTNITYLQGIYSKQCNLNICINSKPACASSYCRNWIPSTY